MFPEGGNYGFKEAENTINALKELCDAILKNKTKTTEVLNRNGYKSLTKIKESFSKMIKPYYNNNNNSI